jgi:protein gp37
MGDTKIEWADKVWNPVTGCTRVSPGCANCYAMRMARRLAGRCQYDAMDPFRITYHFDRMADPLRWRKPKAIFVCSMGDLFHEDIPFDFRAKVWSTMMSATRHRFLVLTKRAERMAGEWRDLDRMGRGIVNWNGPCAAHIWAGVSVEDQFQADQRIPFLHRTRAPSRFVSAEPLIGPVDFPVWSINWIIVGGETGPGARPCYSDWVRPIAERCFVSGTPLFVKQAGSNSPRPSADPLWEKYLGIRQVPFELK